jgi:hypothetical protein
MAKKQAPAAKKQPRTAKKQTSSAKKKPSNVKKTTSKTTSKTPNARKRASAVRSSASAVRSSTLPQRNNDASNVRAGSGLDEYRVDLLPQDIMEDTKESIQNLMEGFRNVSSNNLNAIQRRRKIGAGIRNYGFIEKVADFAETKPQFAQFFSPVDLRNCVRNFDICREIALLLQSFARMVSNTMLVYSDEGFGMSLIYYNSVKEMARRGDPSAMELLRALQPFFKRPKRSSEEPTEKELERDLHSLIHGKKDGKIVVENIKPKLTGGVHKIVDEKFNDGGKFKETEQGGIEE